VTLTEKDRNLFQCVSLGFGKEKVDDQELDDDPRYVNDEVLPPDVLQPDGCGVLEDQLHTVGGELLEGKGRGSNVERIDLGDIGGKVAVEAKADPSALGVVTFRRGHGSLVSWREKVYKCNHGIACRLVRVVLCKHGRGGSHTNNYRQKPCKRDQE